MKTSRLISSTVLVTALLAGPTLAQQKVKLGDNAALRYWAASAQMQDSLSDVQAKELGLILDGSTPYEDVKYKDLIEKNRPALETMARGTKLPNCDWGVEYRLGPDAPVDYVRKALAIGQLNILYAFHLSITGDKDGAARALAAGLRFSHDVGNDGTLFATEAAKNLLVAHLRASVGLVRVAQLSAPQKLVLQKAVAQLGPGGLDWQSAVKRELAIPLGLDASASAALANIVPAYVGVLSNASGLPKLEQMRASAPAPLPEIIPDPKRVLGEKQDLENRLRLTRPLLQ
jgi:hypothetical protein